MKNKKIAINSEQISIFIYLRTNPYSLEKMSSAMRQTTLSFAPLHETPKTMLSSTISSKVDPPALAPEPTVQARLVDIPENATEAPCIANGNSRTIVKRPRGVACGKKDGLSLRGNVHLKRARFEHGTTSSGPVCLEPSVGVCVSAVATASDAPRASKTTPTERNPTVGVYDTNPIDECAYFAENPKHTLLLGGEGEAVDRWDSDHVKLPCSESSVSQLLFFLLGTITAAVVAALL